MIYVQRNASMKTNSCTLFNSLYTDEKILVYGRVSSNFVRSFIAVDIITMFEISIIYIKMQKNKFLHFEIKIARLHPL